MARPDVLLVSVDSLRADAVHQSSPATPFLDAVAANGLAFERCYSTGAWTAPAFVGAMTGERPRSYAPDMSVHHYPETLAEAMSEQGYRTVARLDANYWVSESQGFDRGFDDFENFVDADAFLASKRAEADDDRNELASRLPNALVERFSDTIDDVWDRVTASERLFSALQRADMFTGSSKDGRGAGPLVDEFAECFSSGSGPVFGWIHFMDVHHPYLPDRRSVADRVAFPAPLVNYVNNASVRPGVSLSERGGRLLKRAYDRKVTEVDERIGRLVERVAGDDRDLVVVVLGDHGEEFGEHGRYNHRNRPFDELMRVPLLVRGAGEGRISRSTSLIDLKDAIESVGRGDRAFASEFDTERPCCRYIHHGERVAERTRQALEGRNAPSHWLAVAGEEGKLHYDSETGHVELYDTSTDEREQRDVFDSERHDDILRAALAQHVQERQELDDQRLVSGLLD